MRKIYIIMAVLLAITVLLFALNSGKGDTSARTEVLSVLNLQSEIKGLSDQAVARGSVYELKVVASNISATTASDTQSLSANFKKAFGKTFKAPKAKAGNSLDALKKTENGTAFDSQYKTSVTTALETSTAALQSALEKPIPEELKAALNTALANQTSALQQLQKLP